MPNWFRSNSSKSVIPPVEQAPSIRSEAPSYRSDAPFYRSNVSSYVQSRDGDLSQGGGRNDYYKPSYSSSRYDDAYSPPAEDRYGGSRRYDGLYSQEQRDPELDRERNALFSGADERDESDQNPRNRFLDGPERRKTPPPGEEGEEDVEGIKQDMRFLKQDTVSTTRNALRIAREAEETGRATMMRLGEQSAKLASTERHLDLSKGHSVRAEDNADQIKKLNRSIFIPAITFDKTGKRQAQELKREQRFREEEQERERAAGDYRETENRLGRAASYGLNSDNYYEDDEGIMKKKGRSEQDMALRKAARKRYQFDADEEDDAMEDEIEDNLDEILDVTKRLGALGTGMNQEIRSQNDRTDRIIGKTDKLTYRIDGNVSKLKAI